MLDKIRTQDQYEAIMEMIEKYITKATKLGGFHALNKKDDEELPRLSLLANDYEKMKMLPVSFKQSLHFIIRIFFYAVEVVGVCAAVSHAEQAGLHRLHGFEHCKCCLGLLGCCL